MSHAMDIDDHKADPYLADFCERRDQALASPLDRANAAARLADQASACTAEGTDDCDREFITGQRERVFRAANATAIAERNDDQALAVEFARMAEGEALVLVGFDSINVKLDGLRRPTAHS